MQFINIITSDFTSNIVTIANTNVLLEYAFPNIWESYTRTVYSRLSKNFKAIVKILSYTHILPAGVVWLVLMNIFCDAEEKEVAFPKTVLLVQA